MTSKLTREELLNIIDTDHVQCGEASALARMALAAMDSEPVGTLSVRAMSYSGKKIGTQFGFVHSDAAMKVPEGDYPLYRHAQPAPVVPVLPQRIPDSVYDFLKFAFGDKAWAYADLLWSECCDAIESGGKS